MSDNVKRIWSEEDLDDALAALHADVRTDGDLLASARPDLTNAPTPRRSRRWLVAAAAVVALVAGGLVAQVVSTDERTPGASAAAAGLNAAADRITSADPPVRQGQYLRIRTRGWATAGSETPAGKMLMSIEESIHEVWVPADRTQVWLQRSTRTGRYRWIVGSDEEARKAGIPVGGRDRDERRARCGDFFLSPGERTCAVRGGWQIPKPEWLAGLPRDSSKLYERLRTDAPDNSRGDTELLVYAADALRSGLIPADVRAALYRALALIPDLKVTDRSANLDGRIGIAYGMDDGTTRHDIIIDERTGQFIGERQVSTVADTHEGVPAGTVLVSSSVTTAVVDRIGG